MLIEDNYKTVVVYTCTYNVRIIIVLVHSYAKPRFYMETMSNNSVRCPRLGSTDASARVFLSCQGVTDRRTGFAAHRPGGAGLRLALRDGIGRACTAQTRYAKRGGGRSTGSRRGRRPIPLLAARGGER